MELASKQRTLRLLPPLLPPPKRAGVLDAVSGQLQQPNPYSRASLLQGRLRTQALDKTFLPPPLPLPTPHSTMAVLGPRTLGHRCACAIGSPEAESLPDPPLPQ